MTLSLTSLAPVVEAKKVGVKVSAKRAMDEEDSDVEVSGVKKAAINK